MNTFSSQPAAAPDPAAHDDSVIYLRDVTTRGFYPPASHDPEAPLPRPRRRPDDPDHEHDPGPRAAPPPLAEPTNPSATKPSVTADTRTPAPPELLIDGFDAKPVHDTWHYSRSTDPTHTALFASTPTNIDFFAPPADEDALLTALKLAANRWGAVHITGDAAFQQTSLRLAIDHGIKVANPELQDTVNKELRARASKAAAPTRPRLATRLLRTLAPKPVQQVSDPTGDPDFEALKTSIVPRLEAFGHQAILHLAGPSASEQPTDPVQASVHTEIRRHRPIRAFLDAVANLDPAQPALPHKLLNDSAPRHIQRLYANATRHWSRQCRRPKSITDSVARASWPAHKKLLAQPCPPAPRPSAPPERPTTPAHDANTPAAPAIQPERRPMPIEPPGPDLY